MELKDKVLVITGGSKGFGQALAEAFIKEGARVAICATGEEELKKTAEEIGALGVVADVRDEKAMQNLLDKTVEKFGRLDIWVNNSGIFVPGETTENFDMADVRKMFDVNVFGLMHGSRVALREMKKKNSGTILNILSAAALPGHRTRSSMYAVSKWAAKGFTEVIRTENGESNLNILSVFPGGMKTSIFSASGYQYPDFDSFMDPKKVAEKVINNLKQENPNPELVIRRGDV